MAREADDIDVPEGSHSADGGRESARLKRRLPAGDGDAVNLRIRQEALCQFLRSKKARGISVDPLRSDTAGTVQIAPLDPRHGAQPRTKRSSTDTDVRDIDG